MESCVNSSVIKKQTKHSKMHKKTGSRLMAPLHLKWCVGWWPRFMCLLVTMKTRAYVLYTHSVVAWIPLYGDGFAELFVALKSFRMNYAAVSPATFLQLPR